jgi:hypothetical protein
MAITVAQEKMHALLVSGRVQEQPHLPWTSRPEPPHPPPLATPFPCAGAASHHPYLAPVVSHQKNERER